MKKIKINGHKVTLYEDIEDLPILNYVKFNKMLMIESGIGSDAEGIGGHLSKIGKYIALKDDEKAAIELQNAVTALYIITEELTPQSVAFGALIHDIDGQQVTDLSDSNLREIVINLQIPKGLMAKILTHLKKNFTNELQTYFIEQDASPEEKESYDLLKKRTQMMLDAVQNNGKNNDAAIAKIDSEIFGLYKPPTFSGRESSEVIYDKNFESSCCIVAQRLGVDAKGLTTMAFYQALEVTKKQIDEEKRMYSKSQ